MRNFLLQLLLFHVLLIDKVMCRPNSELKSASDSCKWRPIVRNAKLKGGIGSGTFHRLGYTPNMETCVDLCCHMDVCGVAFRNKDDCFGIECNSDESCESIPADAGDTRVEIAHVRAGHKSGNLTDMTMAGQCKPSTIYKEVTLKGGINAGTYKDVGGVTTMEECQKKCCEFPACDLSFMLAGSCYLVGCGDQKQCAMQPAKESKFHPMISYVTRWNNEGVKHTVLLQEKGIQHTCGKLQPLVKVTLKGGLQAGEFTDVGKVATLAQCYDICCQQESCDLAFMLGQNCFSVQCKDKRLCTTIPAQPSIFNPQIAYVIKRSKGTAKTNIAAVSGDCPKTKVFEKMTLKGGVDAGAYKDHGKVKDMNVCRRICCEMTECHLAFMLGTNCFSVKCASVDACRAQKAKPSAYYPRISYIRKVGSNELLRSTIQPVPSLNQTISGPQFTNVDMSQQHTLNAAVLQNTNLLQQNAIQAKPTGRNNVIESPMASQIPPGKATGQVGFAVTPNGLLPVNNQVLQNTQTTLNKAPGTSTFPTNGVSNTSTTARSSIASTSTTEKSTSTSTSTVKQTSPSVAAFNSSHSNETSVKDQDLMNALEAADSKDVPAKQQNVTAYEEMPINHEKCTPGYLKSNVTLKGGRKSGEFLEIKGLKDMSKCVKRCCEDRDKKCNLAFMLGDTCYSVACKTPDLCRTIAAPPTKFNPQVQYVRGLEEEPIPSTTSTTSTTARSTTTPAPTTSSPSQESDTEDTTTTTQASHKDNSSKQAIKNKIKSCFSQPIVKEKSIKGGKKAGKFKIFKDIKDMDACMAKCCSLKKQCDVAYMEGGKCFSIQCFKKSACTAVTLRESDMNPRFAYMDHFLEKVDEEEAESDSTDLDVNEDSSCVNVEILSNKTLKGGTKAGKFRPMGKEKSMKSCINSCCDRPDCDIAYLLNDHCYAVECTDGSLCQATSDSVKSGDNVQLAYMNKAGVGEKQRDYMVVYIIVGSLAFAATLGGLIWVVFAFSRKQRIKKSHKRLLDDNDDDEEVEEDVVHKRTSRPRYRQPRY